MNKPFNIHDWQAKQRQQRLTENMYIDADEFERENLEFDIKRYIGQTFASWMSPSNPPFAQEYAKSPYIDDLAKGISDVVLNRYKTRNEHHAGDYKAGFLKQSVNTFLDKLKKKTDEGKDYKTVEKIMEKHFSAKKEIDEMSTLGTGTSFNAGSGEGYMTPYAFKKKKKK